MSRKAAPLLLALVALIGVAAVLWYFAFRYQPGAATPERAASDFVVAAARGDQLRASWLVGPLLMGSENGGFEFAIPQRDLAGFRQYWFGSSDTFTLDDVQFEKQPGPGGEGGDVTFVLKSYSTGGKTRRLGTAPAGTLVRSVEVRREDGTWRICAY